MLPENHPPIDFENWSPPGEGDARSPCPALNSLANHGIINHNGRGITKSMMVDALTQAYHLDPMIANLFTIGGLGANPDHSAHSFDLNHIDKHNYIEHDVSLSREDAAFGDQSKFDQNIWSSVIKAYEAAAKMGTDVNGNQVPMTSWATGCHARYSRLMASKQKHEAAGKTFTYGLGQAVASYGETSLALNLLGKDGVAPVQWLRIFFEEERLPYKEGWRAPIKIDQGMLNHGYMKMLAEHQHKADEAKLIALGTPHALAVSILSLTSMMKVPSLGMAHPSIPSEEKEIQDDPSKSDKTSPFTDSNGKIQQKKKSSPGKCVVQ